MISCYLHTMKAKGGA